MASAPEKRKVAVIGSGLAGLTATYLLSRESLGDFNGEVEESYEVHLFEKGDKIGLDAASIDVGGLDGKVYRVDSPMRAFQGGKFDPAPCFPFP